MYEKGARNETERDGVFCSTTGTCTYIYVYIQTVDIYLCRTRCESLFFTRHKNKFPLYLQNISKIFRVLFFFFLIAIFTFLNSCFAYIDKLKKKILLENNIYKMLLDSFHLYSPTFVLMIRNLINFFLISKS